MKSFTKFIVVKLMGSIISEDAYGIVLNRRTAFGEKKRLIMIFRKKSRAEGLVKDFNAALRKHIGKKGSMQ